MNLNGISLINPAANAMMRQNCSCCGCLLEFPVGIRCFRCTICSCVTDLVPSSGSDSTASGVTFEKLEPIFKLAEETGNYEPVEKIVGEVFSSIQALSQSFTMGNDKRSNLGLDLDQVQKTYKHLTKMPPLILRKLMSSTSSLLQRLGRRITSVEEVKALLIILENPVLLRKLNQQELKFHHHQLQRLFGYLSRISMEFGQALIDYFGSLPSEVFRQRVEMLHHFIALRIVESASEVVDQNETRNKNSMYNDWSLTSACKVITLFFTANDSVKYLKTSDFYNTAVDGIDLVLDYDLWQKNKLPFTFCQYPFVVSMGSKIKIMEIDAKRQMEREVQDALLSMIVQRRVTVPYLVLHIRRDHLIPDSLNQISRKGHELKKKLRIEFDNEEGVDAGGLAKEWFLLLVRELFNPQYGMFTIDDESHCIWFNQASLENENEYFLVGVIIGLALYNSTILDVNFPMACYRKLLNYPVTLEDLKVLRPSKGKGLEELLKFEGNVEETFGLTFEEQYDAFGQVQSVPLIPNGSNIPVTNENRQEYVTRCVDYILNMSIHAQFESFKKGFYIVCGGNALSLFRPEEIELLVHGTNQLDFGTLRAITEYEGFNPDEPFIQNFWHLIEEEFDDNLKKKFLSFVTGTDHLPPMETSNFCFKISRLPDASMDKFPISHTCFNQICIPRYRSKEILKERLERAILESEGFGLK